MYRLKDVWYNMGNCSQYSVITVIFKNCILKSFKKWFLDTGGTPTLSNDLKDAYLGPREVGMGMKTAQQDLNF